ncbi:MULTISPECIES: VirB4 family type IV secretion/conjugal transfer ATPase [Xanthomonas translucens group]|uniref:VirB4 family type IV secretion/conjugal transfer ATPase n=1 Tax=Xanthomonas translucens group TaxID=3390202 RepID=UPI0019D6F152|nr:VirB4 family type IV secretion/conjugal transfer ATPase [Xanthomonas translucens]QSQ54771.1 VirB4 family type IV secretion/conjugal transfer ATPase [Xanthomonas translucens pv. undulosa]QSQ62254.1 VirB4 family type IV secretion/conjugal transfer ATPase [Xanthomonas translucens pv. undulosa]WIH07081.1 VirB4 family type IV secretion/conjugal transfer ATPase [Xanthomonas translucens pv. graminis]
MAVTAREIKHDEALRFRKEPSLKKYIPYSYHVTDHVISTVGGEYLSVFKIRGRTHSCASNADLVHWHRDLNQMLKSIGNEHVKFWQHIHHRRVSEYRHAEFPSTFARMFDDNYGQSFSDVPLMVNDLYLTVLYNPVGDLTQKMLARFERPNAEALRELQADALASLEEIVDQLMGSMRPYGIERLGIYYRDERGAIVSGGTGEIEGDDDDEGDLLAEVEIAPAQASAPETRHQYAFSTALEWLGFLANGQWSPVPVCKDRIQTYLMHNRPVSSFWGDVLQLRSDDEVFYSAAIEVRDYDEATEPGQLNTLMEADFEFVLTQSFCCMSMQAARTFLTNQQKSMLETRDPSQSQIHGITAARDDVVSRRFIMGWHHLTLHVYGQTPKEAQQRARKARVMMNTCALIASPVGLASEAAYFAMLPGNQAWIPRPVPINSWNFLSFASFHNFMTGKPANNPWGEAVMLFKTVAGTPLFFNFHMTPEDEDSRGKRPPGSTLILGRIGSGKTTVLDALLTEATKFSPRMFIWDKDQGMYPMVKALGGRYTILRESEPSGFQPLQIAPNKRNIAFAKRLVRVLAETSLGSPIEHSDIEGISAAVEALMGEESLIPIELRNMTTLVQQLPNPYRTGTDDRPTLAALLKPWTRDGEHGWLFDNDRDLIDVTTHDINAFDITEFIVGKDQPQPPARTPMLLYLLYRVRESIDGSRACIQVFDEFAQYLDDPTMDLEIKRGVKTDRKKDCLYVFSTQEPNDALESRIGKTIMQAVVTKILLENPDADPDDYIKGLKLTPSEYQALVTIPENSRQFLIKQGSQSTLAQMKLVGMDREISVLSGTPDNAERLRRIIDQEGTDDPDIWLPKYWDAVLGAKTSAPKRM